MGDTVIVGGGPAGMLLAWQLASNGLPVRVLERHPDFRREFRGELLQRSVVEQFEKAGLWKLLLDKQLTLPEVERQMYVGHTRKVRVPAPSEVGAIVSQPGLLELLHAQCSRFPNYRLDFGMPVIEAIQKDGRVVGVMTKEQRIEGDLVIVCNGRNSPLRKSCGLNTEIFEQTADALWLRFDFSDAPQLLPKKVEVHMHGSGLVVVLQPSTQNRLHIAYSAPGDLNALKKDLPRLRERLVAGLSGEVGAAVGKKLAADTETQVLKIIVDRVDRWHAPGVLFLGDAAHTMSPSGGQGLNVAIRDTFVAANHLVPALKAGQPVDAALLQKIVDERMPEIAAIQAGQTRAGQMVLKPIGVLHMMFTMLGAAMAVFGGKMTRGHGIAPPEPKFFSQVGG
jgi:2-polyprenyl-6-methoxyphenol hydroxylase-like FAD-dependent oxidoreductase